MNVLRRLDRREVAFDFVVETCQPGAFDEEIKTLGAQIIRVERTRNLWSYGTKLAGAISRNAPYDAVHSHVHLFGGFVLAVAAAQSVPMRVAHSHTALQSASIKLGPVKRAYYAGLRSSLQRAMTHGIAVSNPAAVELFGERFRNDPRVRVLPCAIDYSTFQANGRRDELRLELGIKPTARVVGHVGRFDPEKNHGFLMEAFATAAQQDRALHLLLVGGGALRAQLEQQADKLAIASRVTFAGLRADVPALLTAMDAFAFPSQHEGLGLALIEAQAAGLPLVISQGVPPEAIIDGHWSRRIPLADREAWATSLIEAANLPSGRRRASVDERFDIDNNVAQLLDIYRNGHAARRVWADPARRRIRA